MPLEPLCLASDLATATGLAVTDPDLVLALKRASGRFRLEAGHSVTVLEETIHLSGNGTRYLNLPAWPVKDVSVTLNGTPLVEPFNYGVRRSSGILSRRAGWPEGDDNVLVVYSHGWTTDELPEGVQDAVLEHATTLALTYAHVRQEGTGNNSLTLGAEATVGVTQKWATAVEACRLRGRS